MDAAEAEAELRILVAADEDPVLSDAEVAVLLAASRIVDSLGLAPTNADWTETWNLNIGARNGWRLKMGKTAGRFDFGSDVHRFSRSQFFEHCKEMMRMYSKAVTGTAIIGTTSIDAVFDPVIGNLNA